MLAAAWLLADYAHEIGRFGKWRLLLRQRIANMQRLTRRGLHQVCMTLGGDDGFVCQSFTSQKTALRV
ncbi:hypothetical protein B0181_01735 [Moraxella caviae]|uniref:Uncharacterized protein n=1 Tax=Moraxella caviae TaxID=34060 RepID=A0A1T0A9M6_9GAMM|nr:hypothetical protein B0181_01735 [Moraxella caviae]